MAVDEEGIRDEGEDCGHDDDVFLVDVVLSTCLLFFRRREGRVLLLPLRLLLSGGGVLSLDEDEKGGCSRGRQR